MIPPLSDLLAGLGVGLVGGVTSGLLGVSPGGGLVVSANLLLGAEQHVAQAISLFAQIPPTGLSGMKRYWKRADGRRRLASSAGRRLPHRRRRRSAGGGQRLGLLSAMDLCRLSRRIGRHADFTAFPFTTRGDAAEFHWASSLAGAARRGLPRRLFVGLSRNRRRSRDHRGTERRSSGAAASGAIGQPRPFDNSNDDPRGMALLAGRLVRGVAADRRGRRRALGGNRPRRSHGQPGRRDGAASHAARFRLGNGDLHGLSGVGVRAARHSAPAALAFTTR